jgi:GxxExxY protein
MMSKETKYRLKRKSSLSAEEEEVGRAVVNAAFHVHKTLGPGLLERVYEVCFCHVLTEKGFRIQRQIDIPIVFEGMTFEEGLRLDVMVNDLVVCELKALEQVHPVWQAQLLSHMKLTEKRLGYLINFNVPLIKDGIQRIIL